MLTFVILALEFIGNSAYLVYLTQSLEYHWDSLNLAKSTSYHHESFEAKI